MVSSPRVCLYLIDSAMLILIPNFSDSLAILVGVATACGVVIVVLTGALIYKLLRYKLLDLFILTSSD